MRDSWTETTLGAVAEIVGGGTPATSNPAYWDGDIVWLTPTEVVAAPGSVLTDSARKITESGLKNSGARLLPEGTVILTSRASVGFSALAGTPLATNQGFQSLIPSPEINNRFLMFWIQSNQQEFNSRAAGSTFKEISKANVSSISLMLPPLREQQRIVDVMSSVDAYIAALQQQAADARSARNAVLHELLTAGGDDWTETTLGEAASVNPPEAALNQNAPFIPMDSVHVGKRFAQYFEPRGERSGARAKGGDILFARITPCLENGKVAQVPSYVERCGGSTEFIVIRGTAVAISDFLYFWATWHETRVRAARLMTGTTGRQRLSASDLGALSLLLPPLSEQKCIVAVVTDMDVVIHSSEQAVRVAQELRSGLLSSLISGDHEIPESYDYLLGAA